MKRTLEIAAVLVVIGVVSYFGIKTIEKSILIAKQNVLYSQIQMIRKIIIMHDIESQKQAPSTAIVVQGIGLSIFQGKEITKGGCAAIKRVTIKKRIKYWEISTKNGIIYYNNKTGEAYAAIKSKGKTSVVARLILNESNGRLSVQDMR